jgi:predicted outer membrane repeat protein
MSHSPVLWGAKRLGLVALVLAALLVAGAPPASAATLQVCPSGCSFTTIAGALAAAANGDTIGIAAGTYTGGFTVDKNVTLRGKGADQTTITGGRQVVTVAGGVSATIKSVTISGGESAFGGGIFNNGTLTLKESTVSGNTASFFGGGIYNNGGTLTLQESTVSGNTAHEGGGGIVNDNGTVTLTESTVSGNTTSGQGGGILSNGTLTLKESTVSDNTADFGGGIFNKFGGTVTLQESTVSGNIPDDCVGC